MNKDTKTIIAKSPCPFCGSQSISTHQCSATKYWHCQCGTCGCGLFTKDLDQVSITAVDAENKWNIRIDRTHQYNSTKQKELEQRHINAICLAESSRDAANHEIAHALEMVERSYKIACFVCFAAIIVIFIILESSGS